MLHDHSIRITSSYHVTMQSDRCRKCVRRQTLAVLPIRGVPFSDSQLSRLPSNGSKSASRKVAVQQTASSDDNFQSTSVDDATSGRQRVSRDNGIECRRHSSRTTVRPVSAPPRWLGRTPSWPSAFIRVKERILEKVCCSTYC